MTKKVNSAKANLLYKSALVLARRKEPNNVEIVRLLTSAHSLGSGDATYALATWYLHGTHYAKNAKKGTVLLKKAARMCIASACFDLAVSYEKGIVVEKNKERAFALYLEAALRGDGDAKKQVARCFWHGVGVTKNRIVADLWAERFRVKRDNV